MRHLCFLICGIFLFSLSRAQGNGAPKKDSAVTISNSDYDMGKISAGKPLEYNLVIKNISRDTVILQDVKVGCGCTTPKYRAGEKIAPGKTTMIILGFNGDAHGEFVKTADIYFNNGFTRQVKFHGVTITDPASTPVSNAN